MEVNSIDACNLILYFFHVYFESLLAFENANPCVLEPVMAVEIVAPNETQVSMKTFSLPEIYDYHIDNWPKVVI